MSDDTVEGPAAIGRADIIRILLRAEDARGALSDAQLSAVGTLVGMTYEATKVDVLYEPGPAQEGGDVGPRTEAAVATRSFVSVPFAQVTHAEHFGDEPRGRRRPGPGRFSLESHNPEDPAFAFEDRPWFPWRSLEPAVLAALGHRVRRRAVDGRPFVRAVARLRPLRRVPRKHRPAWPPDLLLVVEDDVRFTPFFEEMIQAAEKMATLAGQAQTAIVPASSSYVPRSPPRPGRTALLLPTAKGRPSAAGPVARRADLGEVWRGLDVGSGRIEYPEPDDPGVIGASDLPLTKRRRIRAERLLAAFVPASRVDAELLRQLAYLSPDEEFSAETVLDAWNHEWMIRGDTDALAWSTEGRATARDRYEADFILGGRLIALAERALTLMRQLHLNHYAPSLWYEETLALRAVIEKDGPVWQTLNEWGDIGAVNDFLRDLADAGERDPEVREIASQWLDGVMARRPETQAALPTLSDGGLQLIVACREALDKAEGRPSLRRWRLAEGSGRVAPMSSAEAAHRGFLADFWASTPMLTVQRHRHPGGPLAAPPEPARTAHLGTGVRLDLVQRLVTNRRQALAELREENPWASDLGWDRFGLWAEVTLNDVSFRMRWIEPGTFQMGSPPDEPDRSDDNSLYSEIQHKVTLTHGYWIAETPCTQALWRAVMGREPSRFKGDARPVEQVSWEDAQAFVKAANALYPDLALRLPTEAQWEYACRAGSTEATYVGPLDVDEDGRSAALERVAWYYENSDRETHPVGGKAPNAWGLYDTLGNVREWCHDRLAPYGTGHVTDPMGPEKGTERVLRGGSWGYDARSVRAASRFAYDPSLAFDSFGFRLSRGPALARSGRSPAEAQESQPVPARPIHAELRSRTGPGIYLSTDRMRAKVALFERPPWAHEIGRDRFGLYAVVRVPHRAEGDMPVKFRLRWIPPGRFTMGSPVGEPGRWDPAAGDGENWSQEVRKNLSPEAFTETAHTVMITEGYWMADTPVTQALWAAVREKNPSRFVSEQRPVEQVSWLDAVAFTGELNAQVPGLEARLPTEAQWEHACRAGTTEATYGGPIQILGLNNAPVLDELGWYGGNAAVGFELPNGYDISGWSERQHPGDKGGPHPVAQKTPNAWGLYDALGNVWEWCQDWVAPYGEDDSVDPAGPEKGARRVLRGGSWYYVARRVRAASRLALVPSSALDFIGFRLSRGQR